MVINYLETATGIAIFIWLAVLVIEVSEPWPRLMAA